ncbi:glutamine--fructose-6-phosphate transaminase (isomerizing) [Chloroflexota bacterium]
MCGIVGYIGNRAAQSVLTNSLSRLEYRGYDSCGIAIRGSGITVFKDAVRVEELQRISPLLKGETGIGHTRWATHGEPSPVNAHPHLDCSGRIAVVHNGVITNYQELRQQLADEGHDLVSETDSEVIPHLIEKYYQGNLEEAVTAALGDVKGSYAIVVLIEDEAKLVIARNESPLVVGIGDRETFIASDVPGILDYTNRVIYLEDEDICAITRESIRITNNGAEVIRKEHHITWDTEDINKAGYEHFMLKEIHEQPRVIRDTIREYSLSTDAIIDRQLLIDNGPEALLILACGTSYHAGLVGKYFMEELLGFPVRVELASEFNYCGRTIPFTQAIVITQSGETADVLLALKKLRKTEAGIRTLVITNVMNSTVSRIGDLTIYTKAGPEVGVAATKTFTAQLVALYLLALSHVGLNRMIAERLMVELRQLPAKVQGVLSNEQQIMNCAMYLSRYNNAFFIGRGMNLAAALEGALKLKEISYIHAEGYAAGELKHGTFALLTKDTPVIAIVARDNTYDSMLTSIKEVKARKSPVIALVDEYDEVVQELVDMVIRVPCTSNVFSPVVYSVALQLLAYYTARYRGCPIDFPRNLAKSVTVE